MLLKQVYALPSSLTSLPRQAVWCEATSKSYNFLLGQTVLLQFLTVSGNIWQASVVNTCLFKGIYLLYYLTMLVFAGDLSHFVAILTFLCLTVYCEDILFC